jgi:hypothetical protein
MSHTEKVKGKFPPLPLQVKFTVSWNEATTFTGSELETPYSYISGHADDSKPNLGPKTAMWAQHCVAQPCTALPISSNKVPNRLLLLLFPGTAHTPKSPQTLGDQREAQDQKGKDVTGRKQ